MAGRIVELRDGEALLSVGTSTLSVPFGSEVQVEGSRVRLGPPDRTAEAARRAARRDDKRAAKQSDGYVPVEPTEASEALRAWRKETARKDGMPPYIVLSDRHLEGIVEAAPATLAELGACKGIGPMKLEKWGDEILAVLAEGSGQE